MGLEKKDLIEEVHQFLLNSRMGKKIFYILVFITVLFIGNQVYLYSKEDHNLIFIISNNNNWLGLGNNPISIDIFIDNNNIYHNDTIYDFYNIVETKTDIGKHKLKVCINSQIIKEKDIYVIPVKWIMIEYPDPEGILITTSNTAPSLK